MLPEYVRAQRAIATAARRWEKRLGLATVTVRHTFLDTVNDEVIADTNAKWEYREATIRWFLPTCATLTDAQLEATVVHELVHVLLAPMESHVKDRHGEQCEYAVESVARAFLAVYQ